MHHNDIIFISPEFAYQLLLSGFFFHPNTSSLIGSSRELADLYINNIKIPTRKPYILGPHCFFNR